MDAIYIHIPFCMKKCAYCDFHSFEGKLDESKRYVDYLIKDFKNWPTYEYDTIYFGGGTPSLLDPDEIGRILKEMNYNKNSEITLELNPATANLNKLKAFKKNGINRLSIGIQSFNDDILTTLGRLHSSEKAINTFNNARDAGFDNISIDLMFAVPGQGIDELKKDLETIKLLNPDHISIYSLIWEEGTPFWDMLQKGILKECDNDLEADMFELIIDTLKDMGYVHYEISNFSKPNMEARHNSKYWENKEYIALGIGASFYTNNFRGKNVLSFNKYYEAIDNSEKPWLEKEEIFDKKEYEYMLGLRLLNKGILPTENKIIDLCQKLENDGFLKKYENRYILTRKGLFLGNSVFEKFL
ncbi:MAG: radical SAM family heme chaperone HemW [Fusobacteriaceae bacterium]|nr:radical SAM family heme chaperone HemW [Fusobacteriaceae bacterium]MBN2837600.1 radical SAM family heme chaperone HemW [Fusobacteriaceae bacterium]